MPNNTVMAKSVFEIGKKVILRVVNGHQGFTHDEYDYAEVVKVGRKYVTVMLDDGTTTKFDLQTRYEKRGGAARYYIYPNKAAYMQQLKNERDELLDKLLEPIIWSYSTSIRYRQDLVVKRRSEVRLVYPFLTEDEKARAKEWLRKERYEGLWE